MPKNERKALPEEMSFEQAYAQLAEIVNLLERGDLPLEKSLELFQEGVRLTRYCSSKLDEVEGKIETLVRGGEKTEPFDVKGAGA